MSRTTTGVWRRRFAFLVYFPNAVVFSHPSSNWIRNVFIIYARINKPIRPARGRNTYYTFDGFRLRIGIIRIIIIIITTVCVLRDEYEQIQNVFYYFGTCRLDNEKTIISGVERISLESPSTFANYIANTRWNEYFGKSRKDFIFKLNFWNITYYIYRAV